MSDTNIAQLASTFKPGPLRAARDRNCMSWVNKMTWIFVGPVNQIIFAIEQAELAGW